MNNTSTSLTHRKAFMCAAMFAAGVFLAIGDASLAHAQQPAAAPKPAATSPTPAAKPAPAAPAQAAPPAPAQAAPPAPVQAAPAAPVQPLSVTPQVSEYSLPTDVGPALRLTAGKSTLIKLPADISRLSIGNPDVVDTVLINPREVYLLGKKVGATNVFLWAKSGRTTIFDVIVGMDTGVLQDTLHRLMPSEKTVAVNSLSDSVVLSGKATDPMKASRLVSLAEVYSGGKKVVNLMQVDGSQQVMLEVKVAEVSKTLIDKLGVELTQNRTIGRFTYSLLAGFLTGSAGTAAITSGSQSLSLDAEMKKGLVKILAEPTIMAISGQEGAFLAGGKVFIPVPQSQGAGASVITLEEKEFGVGLRFTPTVLDEGRINLRVTPEVSELSQVGTTVSTVAGLTNILPTITTRRASTTVQLRDGESFAIGGLIKSNVAQVVKAFPILGELPIIGPLFRSSEFQSDRSELLFIVTPRLVKPLPPNYALPTDNFNEPSRTEFFLEGRMEGQGKSREPAAPAQPAPQAPAARPQGTPGGFEMK